MDETDLGYRRDVCLVDGVPVLKVSNGAQSPDNDAFFCSWTGKPLRGIAPGEVKQDVILDALKASEDAALLESRLESMKGKIQTRAAACGKLLADTIARNPSAARDGSLSEASVKAQILQLKQPPAALSKQRQEKTSSPFDAVLAQRDRLREACDEQSAKLAHLDKLLGTLLELCESCAVQLPEEQRPPRPGTTVSCTHKEFTDFPI
ncbi:hypothetical protein DIPPA_17157 [Diplonema papillatum]|nr:hypothetical protein DIPPA_17157 [Diplonema papillatum]